MEKVWRRNLKKREKNKGQQQLRNRWMLNWELGTTVSGNAACALRSVGLWWEQEDKKEETEGIGNGTVAKGEKEIKGYCAAQLAYSNVNLSHYMFHYGSSVFPRGRRGGRCHPELVLPQKAILLCLLISKRVMLRKSDHRWRPGFHTQLLPSLASYGEASLHMWGISLFSCCPPSCSLIFSHRTKDSVSFGTSWLIA